MLFLSCSSLCQLPSVVQYGTNCSKSLTSRWWAAWAGTKHRDSANIRNKKAVRNRRHTYGVLFIVASERAKTEPVTGLGWCEVMLCLHHDRVLCVEGLNRQKERSSRARQTGDER